jgi:lysophospholipase L1-like esterase
MEKLLLMMLAVFIAACSSNPVRSEQASDIRLRNCMAKLRGGGKISVVALGGSITTGHQAQPPESAGWAGLVNVWLQEKARESGGTVEFHNSGASGTDSAFASVRAGDHALAYNPDLLIVEYAVNDQWLNSKVRRRSFEGVIRRILDDSPFRAVIIIALNEKGSPQKSTFREQAAIAKHYNIPVLAWADWVEASQWDTYFTDKETIHPNNEGHASIASGIIKFMNAAWDPPQAGPVKTPPPPPLVSAEFQNVKYIGSTDSAAVVKNTGWESKPAILPEEWYSRGGQPIFGWTTTDPQANISIRVKGKSVGVLFAESGAFFNCLAWLEDAEGKAKSAKTVIKNFVSHREGYYGFAYAEIADNLDPSKEYILRIGVNSGAKSGASAHIIGVVCTENRE